jgi:pimeloyl-ACP methyl ester carboxylesterase
LRGEGLVGEVTSGGPMAQTRGPAGDLPEVEGVEHRFIDADGLRVHVAQAGDGPPVLLLHGWPQHWYMWRGVIERLAPQFRLIAPDLRGFGWSEAPGEGYDPETFAIDQFALMDALEIERVSVIGHDWGGFVAILMGLADPERVERMVVLNAPHPWPRMRPRLLVETWRSWYALLNAAPLLGKRLARSSELPRMILSRGNVTEPFPEGLDVYLNQFQEPARAEATVALYRYYLRAFARGIRGSGQRQRRLTVPTLLLFGAKDLFVSPELIKGGKPNADELRIELVPDCGHFIANEKPDLVARRALAFLS